MPNILYVEGATDKEFFKAFCKKHGLVCELEALSDEENEPEKLYDVLTPNEANQESNGKDELRKELGITLKGLSRLSQINKYGFVFDADNSCEDKLSELIRVFNQHDFVMDSNYSGIAGFSFYKEGYQDVRVGVWIMPNNQDKGELEHLIKRALPSNDNSLLRHAVESVDTILEPLFPKDKKTKAQMLTYLAWQKNPTQAYYVLCDQMDKESQELQNLITWLQNTFNAKTE